MSKSNFLISTVFHYIEKLKETIEVAEGDISLKHLRGSVSYYCNSLRELLETYFPRPWSISFLIAAYLDPRLKKTRLTKEELKTVKNCVRKCIDHMEEGKNWMHEFFCLPSCNKCSKIALSPPSKQETNPEEKFVSFRDSIFPSMGRDDFNEIKHYENSNIAISNPLDWWRENASLYPKLAQLARVFLCVPASSIDCERMFSDSSNIQTKKRNCLGESISDDLLFLFENDFPSFS